MRLQLISAERVAIVAVLCLIVEFVLQYYWLYSAPAAPVPEVGRIIEVHIKGATRYLRYWEDIALWLFDWGALGLLLVAAAIKGLPYYFGRK